MNDGPSSSALRELRSHMLHPSTLVVLAGVSVVLAMIGPFGTDDLLPLGLRLPYWLCMVGPTYVMGSLGNSLATRMAPKNRRGLVLEVVIGTLLSGLGVTAVVFLVNLAAFGWLPDLHELPAFLAQIFGVTGAISITVRFAERSARKEQVLSAGPEPKADTATAPRMPEPQILDRVPFDKRGPLMALSVEDHYVRVITEAGETMVLMRLRDAIKETGSTLGAQVHRSHWVAFGAVRAARRDGERAILTLKDGQEIPVSRANIANIKEAGLLPR